MKNILKISALIGLSAISSNVFAFGGYGHGYGHGFGRNLTDEQRAQLQSMSPEERQAYVQQLRQQQGLPTQQNATAMQQAGQYGRGYGRGRMM
jgi:hypothetical protein